MRKTNFPHAPKGLAVLHAPKGLVVCSVAVLMGIGGLTACDPAPVAMTPMITGLAASSSGGDGDDEDSGRPGRPGRMTRGGGNDDAGDGDGTSGNPPMSTTSAATAFDTLTTDTPLPGPNDPTNPTGSNETGAVTVQVLPEDIIDDMEDGDAVIYEESGRIGIWYSVSDCDDNFVGEVCPGQINPASCPIGSAICPEFLTTAGGPGQSAYAVVVRGTGFNQWGAAVGFDISNSGSRLKKPYNASAYTGVAFQARGVGRIRFSVPVQAVVPMAAGGACITGCDDAHSTPFGMEIVLTPTWQQVVVPFSSLVQGNFGTPAPFNPATIMGLLWQVNTNAGTPLGPFELALDDIGFYR